MNINFKFPLRALSFSISILLLVTGCFVEPGSNTVIPLPKWEDGDDKGKLKPVTYPLYKNGDTLEYSVDGNYTPDGQIISNLTSGSLKVNWTSVIGLNQPYDIQDILQDVLMETRTLVVNQLGTFTSVRYFVQDSIRCLELDDTPASPVPPSNLACTDSSINKKDNSNYGSLYLLAVKYQGANATNAKFWSTNDFSGPAPLFTDLSLQFASPGQESIKAPKFFDSPLPQSTQDGQSIVKFRMMAGCNVARQGCKESATTVEFTSIYNFTNKNTKTFLGIFETIQLGLLAYEIRRDVSDPSPNYLLASSLDTNAACNDPLRTILFGEIEVHPSVGIVYMHISCSSSSSTGNSYSLYFTLNQVSGSIVIP